ncbi:hypothetical protein AgCh_004684 [Apium graveolens]
MPTYLCELENQAKKRSSDLWGETPYIDVGVLELDLDATKYVGFGSTPGFGRLSMVATSSAQSAATVMQARTKDLTSKEDYNIDVYSNTMASVRLRVVCEKLKKVLSANPEAPLNIECLMDEKDVKGFIK